MPERSEGRLARWSRLKVEGGASPEEQAAAEARRRDDGEPASDGEATVAVAETPDDGLPDPASLPGGVQRRQFVAPMVPLADPEEGEAAYAAAPAEALAMLEGEVAHDAEPPVDPEERELTPEEQEVVDQLPPIESLTKDSDFTPFLADNVPDFIRKRAMRALWLSDPFFGFQDGLDDYAENFRVIDKLIDVAADSSYRPGKGYDLGGDEADEDEIDDDVEAEAEAEAEVAEAAASEEDDGQASGSLAEADDADEAGDGEAADTPEPEPERLASSSVRKPGDAT